MKPARVSSESAAATVRQQLELTKQSNLEFETEIKLTDEMIAGLALLRDGVERLPWFTAGPEELEPPDAARQIQCGLTILLTNWGRRLQCEKNQLARNIAYNQNLIRQAETGLVLP